MDRELIRSEIITFLRTSMQDGKDHATSADEIINHLRNKFIKNRDRYYF